MQEKFLKLSRKVQSLIVVTLWLITAAGFAGTFILKSYESIPWLEVILTCVAMFLCVAAICFTVFYVFANEMNSKN